MTSPADVTTMPVPAPRPTLAVVVLMSTSPGSTCAASESVVPEAAAALPDGAELDEPLCDGVSPGNTRPNGEPARADGDEELGGQAKCATAPPATAASATTTSPASSGRRHSLRGVGGGSPIGTGGVCSGSAI